jgi:Protein of unknown function (DUF2637)
MMRMPKHALSKFRSTLDKARSRQSAAVTVLVIVIAAGLAAYCAAASYDTVSHLAARYGVALPRLNPLGIDGGLAGLIIMDIALTWLGEPIWWLRLAARVFAAGLIAANAAAGWPSLTGTGLRIAAPVLFVIITEAARTRLLRRLHAAERERRAAARKRRRDNRIPRVRWLLDFRGTLALWKRMRLWREPSYRVAVNMELERLAAIEKLAMKYGDSWKSLAPANLVWMLESGVRMPEALAMVAELTGPRQTALEAAVAALKVAEAERDQAQTELADAVAKAEILARKLGGNGGRKGAGNSGRKAARKPTGTTGRPKPEATAPETAPDETADVDSEALVLKYLAEGYSASEAGRKAGLSDSRGRQIARNLAKTAPQDAAPDTAAGE